jgi:predicted DNA-binding protein YlxM (UPF0122 family)
MNMVEDVVRKGLLLDIYGPLMTEKQRRCMEMYYLMDLSLAEIGEELHISRQGVYDMLSRASKSLESYEAKLHLLDQRAALRSSIEKAAALMEAGGTAQVEQARGILRDLDI